jgi:hypothetical protein
MARKETDCLRKENTLNFIFLNSTFSYILNRGHKFSFCTGLHKLCSRTRLEHWSETIESTKYATPTWTSLYSFTAIFKAISRRLNQWIKGVVIFSTVVLPSPWSICSKTPEWKPEHCIYTVFFLYIHTCNKV